MSELLNKIKDEYVLVHTKKFSSPIRGYLTKVDDEYILIEESSLKQGDLFNKDELSKPFFVIPINTIDAIAGVDPEQLKARERAEREEIKEQKMVDAIAKDSMMPTDPSTRVVHKEGTPSPPPYMRSNPFVVDPREPEVNSSGLKEVEFDEVPEEEYDESLDAMREMVRREMLEEFKKRYAEINKDNE